MVCHPTSRSGVLVQRSQARFFAAAPMPSRGQLASRRSRVEDCTLRVDRPDICRGVSDSRQGQTAPVASAHTLPSPLPCSTPGIELRCGAWCDFNAPRAILAAGGGLLSVVGFYALGLRMGRHNRVHAQSWQGTGISASETRAIGWGGLYKVRPCRHPYVPSRGSLAATAGATRHNPRSYTRRALLWQRTTAARSTTVSMGSVRWIIRWQFEHNTANSASDVVTLSLADDNGTQ